MGWQRCVQSRLSLVLNPSRIDNFTFSVEWIHQVHSTDSKVMAYQKFATIRLAVAWKLAPCSRFSIEISERSNKTVTSFNLDDFPEDDSDMADCWSLSAAKKQLPESGRILARAYAKPDGDFLDDYVLTLSGCQVVAINGAPWTPPVVSHQSKKASSARQKEADLLVRSTVKKLLTSLRRSKDYHWNGKNAPAIKVSFSPKRRLSRGGINGLSFALSRWVRDGQLRFPEYAAFRSDPDIGETTGDWMHVVKVLAAHELAHWVQYSRDVVKPAGVDYRKPHGVGFREIYRFLRLKVV